MLIVVFPVYCINTDEIFSLRFYQETSLHSLRLSWSNNFLSPLVKVVRTRGKSLQFLAHLCYVLQNSISPFTHSLTHSHTCSHKQKEKGFRLIWFHPSSFGILGCIWMHFENFYGDKNLVLLSTLNIAVFFFLLFHQEYLCHFIIKLCCYMVEWHKYPYWIKTKRKVTAYICSYRSCSLQCFKIIIYHLKCSFK